jgi:hypothetical protein
MIYVVYLSTLIPHIKVRDNYPLSPIIIFSFPTAMQEKVRILYRKISLLVGAVSFC